MSVPIVISVSFLYAPLFDDRYLLSSGELERALDQLLGDHIFLNAKLVLVASENVILARVNRLIFRALSDYLRQVFDRCGTLPAVGVGRF